MTLRVVQFEGFGSLCYNKLCEGLTPGDFCAYNIDQMWEPSVPVTSELLRHFSSSPKGTVIILGLGKTGKRDCEALLDVLSKACEGHSVPIPAHPFFPQETPTEYTYPEGTTFIVVKEKHPLPSEWLEFLEGIPVETIISEGMV